MKRTLIVISLLFTCILYGAEKKQLLLSDKTPKAQGVQDNRAQNAETHEFCPCPACLVLGQYDQPYTWKTYARAGTFFAVVGGLNYLSKMTPAS